MRFNSKVWILLAGGLFFTLSFEKIGISYIAWIGLIPLLYSINNSSSVKSFKMGWIFGMAHFTSLVYWVVYAMYYYGGLPVLISIPLLLLLSAYLSIYIGLFCAMINRLCKKPTNFFLIPIFWTVFEYIRSLSKLSFPWEFLGYTQYKNLKLIQISDILGVYGLSALIVFINISLFLLILYFFNIKWNNYKITVRHLSAYNGSAIVILSVILIYGHVQIKEIDSIIESSKKINAACIQGNISQEDKWDSHFMIHTTKKYINLSKQIIKQKPDLLVWPETALPFYYEQGGFLKEYIKKNVKEFNSCLLTGCLNIEQKDNTRLYYNSSILIKPDDKNIEKYHKTQLVPYGEFVPFKNIFPFINKLTQAAGDFSPGIEGNTLSCHDYFLGVQICFEIIFPNLSRKMVNNGADILINITNDAWYGTSSAPYQHFSMVVLRAVENKRSLARSANTGISGLIDPVGRILKKSDLFKEQIICHELPVIKIKTIYTSYGDIFAWLCIIICSVSLTINILYSRFKAKK